MLEEWLIICDAQGINVFARKFLYVAYIKNFQNSKIRKKPQFGKEGKDLTNYLPKSTIGWANSTGKMLRSFDSGKRKFKPQQFPTAHPLPWPLPKRWPTVVFKCGSLGSLTHSQWECRLLPTGTIEKIDKLCPLSLRKKDEKTQINKIRNQSGELTNDTNQIKSVTKKTANKQKSWKESLHRWVWSNTESRINT